MLAVKGWEVPMEQRMSKVEVHIEHMQNDVAEIKIDIRRLDAKLDTKLGAMDFKFENKLDAMDAKFDKKFEAMDAKFDAKFDKLQDALTQLALRTEKGFADLTRWGIGLYIMLVAGMATGFMWIIQRLPA